MTLELNVAERTSAARAAAVTMVPESARRALERAERLLLRITRSQPRPTPDRAWERFLSLPADHREKIVQSWNDLSVFMEGALDEGLDGADEIGMFRYAVGKLGLLGDSELFSRIEPDDVVEILSDEFVQVYRSFSYFSLCNYSLLELSAYPFFELYERSSLIFDQLMESGQRIFRGETSYVNLEHIAEHSLREILTDEGAVFSMREKCHMKIVSPQTGRNFLFSVKKVKELASAPSGVRFI